MKEVGGGWQKSNIGKIPMNIYIKLFLEKDFCSPRPRNPHRIDFKIFVVCRIVVWCQSLGHFIGLQKPFLN